MNLVVRVEDSIYDKEYEQHWHQYQVSIDGWDVCGIEVEHYMRDGFSCAHFYATDQNMKKLFPDVPDDVLYNVKSTPSALKLARPFLESHDMDMSYLDEVYVEPEKWKPKKGETYFSIEFTYPNCVFAVEWADYPFEETLYNQGLVFQTEEEAINCATKMLRMVG